VTIFDVRPEAGLQRAPEGEGWVAASHAAVQSVLREPGCSSDHRNATGLAGYQADRGIPEIAGELLSKILLFMDAPDHTRLRGLISKAFTPRSIEQLRPRISKLTEELLAPLRDAGRFDVIEDFAFPLPVTVICELLGVPAEDRELFRQLTRDMAVILDWDVTPQQFGGAAGAALNFAAYLVPLFEQRRRSPEADLISALVAAEEAGDRLGADELLTTVVLLLTAGHETTMNLIGNGLLALLRNPGQLEVLRSRPDLMPWAVEELLRYDSPVRLTVRTAVKDHQLEGETVQAGEQLIVLLDAANHDPAVFSTPDTLDVTRDAHRHVAFGAGAHYCLGAALARAEAQIALAALIALPELAMAIDEPTWRPLVTFHALESLPVTCRPAC
jgi:cytochrome P450